jgi:hypothetical protein
MRKGQGMFFFEKKNQKTLSRWSSHAISTRTPQADKSLFASCSSEKEGLALYEHE